MARFQGRNGSLQLLVVQIGGTNDHRQPSIGPLRGQNAAVDKPMDAHGTDLEPGSGLRLGQPARSFPSIWRQKLRSRHAGDNPGRALPSSFDRPVGGSVLGSAPPRSRRRRAPFASSRSSSSTGWKTLCRDGWCTCLAQLGMMSTRPMDYQQNLIDASRRCPPRSRRSALGPTAASSCRWRWDGSIAAARLRPTAPVVRVEPVSAGSVVA